LIDNFNFLNKTCGRSKVEIQLAVKGSTTSPCSPRPTTPRVSLAAGAEVSTVAGWTPRTTTRGTNVKRYLIELAAVSPNHERLKHLCNKLAGLNSGIEEEK